MSRLGPGSRAVIGLAVVGFLVGGGLVPRALGAAAPDRSEVVLVLDFSASILNDAANRNRFGAALEGIADRVDATSSDLVAGDATVSIVQFASRAADYPGCTDLKLLDSPETVGRLADCLRSVGTDYRQGLDPALTQRIGIDTNYVAAMERAATHLPADAVRPVLILATDGKHDVPGVPASQVLVTRDALFGSRTPFALLPVGIGLDPAERETLETGLLGLQIIRDMPACVTGAAFTWPQVVFESADEAGNAVAVALQNATCTFTVAPSSAPPPSPTPAAGPAPGPVQGIRLTAGDARVEMSWDPPATTDVPVVDYAIRCRGVGGAIVESAEGVSLETSAVVEGLTNGTAYECEVAAVGTSSQGPWTSTTATPVGRPAPPQKPTVQALDGGLVVSATSADPTQVSRYHYECSPDQGGTWPDDLKVPSAPNSPAQIGNLTNGVAYVCRAFAENATGLSDASPISDAVSPCGSMLECTPILPPILAVIGAILAGLLLFVLVGLFRDRRRGYVVAVIDTIHSANLGHGSKLGLAFVRPPDSGRVTGIVADRSKKADIRIRPARGGRFVVTDKAGRQVATSGESIIATDSLGVRHDLVLRAFATKAASSVSTRR